MEEKFKTVDDYIRSFPDDIKILLEQMRETILRNAEGAEESISYRMPAYKLNGRPLVYFAGYRNHIGFYATPTGHSEFAEELSQYKQGRGSVQFPVREPLPLSLVERIVRFRVRENLNR